jgi:hypothetical protein
MPPGCPNSGVPFGAPVSTHQARRGLAVGKWYRQALVVMCRCALYIPSGVPRCDGMVREVSQSPYALTLTLTPTPTLTLLEQRSVANPQAVRRWARPPCRHINIQSCCCLGSVRGGGPNPNSVLLAECYMVDWRSPPFSPIAGHYSRSRNHLPVNPFVF